MQMLWRSCLAALILMLSSTAFTCFGAQSKQRQLSSGACHVNVVAWCHTALLMQTVATDWQPSDIDAYMSSTGCYELIVGVIGTMCR